MQNLIIAARAIQVPGSPAAPVQTGVKLVSRGQVLAGSPCRFMARLTDLDGQRIIQEDVTAISYTVTNVDTTTPTANGSATVSAVVSDNYQTDGTWGDSTGYNFALQIAGNAWESAGTYQVEIFLSSTAQSESSSSSSVNSSSSHSHSSNSSSSSSHSSASSNSSSSSNNSSSSHSHSSNSSSSSSIADDTRIRLVWLLNAFATYGG